MTPWILKRLNVTHYYAFVYFGCLENDDLENDDLENNDLENNDLENDDLEKDDLENNELENDDLENDDRDGVARRIKGLEGWRRREIRGRWEGIMKG